MLTVNAGMLERKDRLKSNLDNGVEDFCSFIKEFDPDFIFLPAYLVARKVQEKMKKGKSRKKALKEIRQELNIGKNMQSERIIKTAEKILNNRGA